MATANEVISDAFDEIGINVSEESLSASDAQRAIRMLNDMMTMWDAKGINLGYTSVSGLNDVLTVPDGAILGIKKMLGITLSPTFKGDITEALVESAKDAMYAIRNLAITIGRVYPPSTLPIGSGNYSYSQPAFYPDMESLILTETGGSIAIEDDTEI